MTTLTWSLFINRTENANTFGSGSSVQIDPQALHQVVLKFKDPVGLKEWTVSGFGECNCSTKTPDPQGEFFTAPDPQTINIPTRTNIPDRVFTDIEFITDLFVFNELSAGLLQFGNMSAPGDFLCDDGVLHYRGLATNLDGVTTEITLDLVVPPSH